MFRSLISLRYTASRGPPAILTHSSQWWLPENCRPCYGERMILACISVRDPIRGVPRLDGGYLFASISEPRYWGAQDRESIGDCGGGYPSR